MTKRVLISGGYSVLGCALAARLRRDGWLVWQGSRSASDADFSVEMDVADAAQVRRAIENVGPQLIFHLAASHAQELDPAYAVNVRGVENVFAALAAAGLPTRTVVMGSAAEYGVVAAAENPLAEERLLKPVSTYGLSKAWQTMLSLKAAFDGRDVVVARMFNLDAPGLPSRLFVGAVERQIQEILGGTRSEMQTGSLDAVRDYVGLDEAVEQLLAIAARGSKGTVYHVASGKPISMRELLEQKLAAAGLSGAVIQEQQSGTARPGYDVPLIYANIARTRALFTECQ